MKTGLVLEIKENRAVILDGSGNFREVERRNGWQAGDVVTLPGARKATGWAAALAACLMVCFLGLGSWLWFGQVSLVSLDVNPSVELRLNYFDRVTSVNALNDQGEALLDNSGVKGMTADQAVSTLLESDFLGEYLDREKQVTLTVQSASQGREEKLTALVDATAVSAVSGGMRVNCHSVDSTLVQEAHSHGVTAGKYLALLELQEADPQIDITEYAHCGIGEIERETARCQEKGHGNPAGGKGHGNGNGGGHHQKGHGHE